MKCFFDDWALQNPGLLAYSVYSLVEACPTHDHFLSAAPTAVCDFPNVRVACFVHCPDEVREVHSFFVVSTDLCFYPDLEQSCSKPANLVATAIVTMAKDHA